LLDEPGRHLPRLYSADEPSVQEKGAFGNSAEEMGYDAASSSVIYRFKMHASFKRNFQVMSVVGWLELLCRHIPDRLLCSGFGWFRGDNA